MNTSLIEPVSTSEPWALKDLPPFPWITTKVLQLFAAPADSVDVGRLTELLRADASLSSELLRRANSAMFGLRAQVGTVERAVTMLGLDRVKGLSMTIGLGVYLKSSLKVSALRRCWRHSLGCALLAEELAPAFELRPEQGYTAGLLHDVGRLALLVKYPQSYADLLNVCIDNGFDLMRSERDLFDIDHCEAGRWLAEGWQFPAELAGVIGDHHAPPNGTPPLVELTHTACRLADYTGFAVTQSVDAEAREQLVETLPAKVRRITGDDIEALGRRISERVNTLE